jgi:hypothetical protein
MNTTDLINLLTSTSTAIATILLAVVAVFAQTIKTWFYKTKLNFYIDSKDPYVIEMVEIEMHSSEPKKSISINLKIINNGNINATSTQLYIEKIFRIRQENQTYRLEKEFIPINFLWNNDSELKSLTPLMSHYIEIARIQRQVEYSIDQITKKGTINSRDELFLSVTDPYRSGELFYLGKGTFILPIKAYSENMKIEKEIYLEIFWNGHTIDQKSDKNFFIKIKRKDELSKDVISAL